MGALGRTSLLPSLLGLFQERDLQKSEELMRDLEITHLADEHIMTLSGGEKKRVAIARTLLQGPEVLIADEFLSELDEIASEKVMQRIRLEQAQRNMSILLIEHNIQAAMKYADGIIIIKNGTIVKQFRTSEVTSDLDIKEFLADEE